MAILTAYHSVNLNTSSIWNGNVTFADTGHIQITDGIHLQNHYGTFSYGKSGYLNGGNLTSMDYSESALKIYDLSDANYKALTFFVYLSSSKASRLLNYIFAGNDTLNGSPENDVLNGYGGSNTLIGGSGDDRYFVGKGDKVIENPNGGIDTINCISTYTLPDNVENLILLGKSSINGTGNILDNTLNGNTGANVLDGGLGADTMIGGNGNDTYIVDNPGDTVIENSSGGKDLVKFNSSIDYIDYTLGANIENLTLTGSAPKSTGTGNELNNIITGNEFDNTLDGAGGADTLTGGAGDDTYIVYLKTNGQLEDKIKEVAGGGTDTLQLRGHADLSKASTLNLAANLEKLDVSETGNTWLNLKGNALDNILTGNDAANVITGGNGNDTLTGGDGSDLLIGGKGTDTYNLKQPRIQCASPMGTAWLLALI